MSFVCLSGHLMQAISHFIYLTLLFSTNKCKITYSLDFLERILYLLHFCLFLFIFVFFYSHFLLFFFFFPFIWSTLKVLDILKILKLFFVVFIIIFIFALRRIFLFIFIFILVRIFFFSFFSFKRMISEYRKSMPPAA